MKIVEAHTVKQKLMRYARFERDHVAVVTEGLRQADVLSITKGRLAYEFEVKVSRSDLNKELAAIRYASITMKDNRNYAPADNDPEQLALNMELGALKQKSGGWSKISKHEEYTDPKKYFEKHQRYMYTHSYIPNYFYIVVPDKHQEMKQFCDKWYLVIPDESIIKEGELPEDWGLMVASGRGRTIKVKKEAPKLKPVDVDRLLLASIFRNVTEKMIPYEMHQNALKQTKKYAEENILRIQKTRLEEAEKTEQRIKEFEDATGLKFSDWNRDHLALAATVKKALEGRYDEVEKKLEQFAQRAEKLAKYARGENVSTWDL